MERDWEKLRKWMIRRRLEGLPVSLICIQAKVSRKVFYFGGTDTKPKDGLVCRRSLEIALVVQNQMTF